MANWLVYTCRTYTVINSTRTCSRVKSILIKQFAWEVWVCIYNIECSQNIVSACSGLTLPLTIVVICYWKCRVTTNISHWLKVQSRWFKNYIFAKKCMFDQLLDFHILLLLFLYTLLLCHILLFGCWIFSIASGCQVVWIQIRPNILSGLIWVQTVCNLGYQQTTKVPPSGQRVRYKTTFWLKPWLKLISFGSNFFYLAKVLPTTNSKIKTGRFIWIIFSLSSNLIWFLEEAKKKKKKYCLLQIVDQQFTAFSIAGSWMLSCFWFF